MNKNITSINVLRGFGIDIEKASKLGPNQRWITIDGKHVLINTKSGNVESGNMGPIKKIDKKSENIKSFNNHDEGREYIEKNFKLIDDYNEEQKKQIYNYRKQGYAVLNKLLREDKKLTPTQKKLFNGISSAINDEGSKLKEDIKVHRGINISDPSLRKQLEDLNIGDVFIEKGFLSTTLNSSKDDKINPFKYVQDKHIFDGDNKFIGVSTDKEVNKNTAIFNIIARKGTKALALKQRDTDKDKFFTENELLFDSNTKLKLLSKEGNNFNFEIIN